MKAILAIAFILVSTNLFSNELELTRAEQRIADKCLSDALSEVRENLQAIHSCYISVFEENVNVVVVEADWYKPTKHIWYYMMYENCDGDVLPITKKMELSWGTCKE